MQSHSKNSGFGPKGSKLARKFTSWTFRVGRWIVLPSLGFWQIRIDSLEEDQCVVSLPYSYLNRNPFHSIYFAALAGAGELSTGAYLQCFLAEHQPYSMLVTKTEMSFSKKAIDRVQFVCSDRRKIEDAIQTCLETNQPQKFTLESRGRSGGSEICKIQIEWSIKLK